MADEDAERRIADLERQLAERRRGADLAPAGPDYAGASRRFVAFPPFLGSKTNPTRTTIYVFGVVAAAVALNVVFATVGGGTGAVFGLFGFFALVLVGVFAYYRWYNRRNIIISVTSEGLTVNQRRGDVYSFRDAQLGLWAYGMTMGTALHLHCGPHQFVLGGRDHRIANRTRLEAQPARSVDAWLWAPDFDELLAMGDNRSRLDVRPAAPGEPTRCLLFPNIQKIMPRGPLGAFKAGELGMQLWESPPGPNLAIDIGDDAIWVIDPNGSAPTASAWLADVTATPETYKIHTHNSIAAWYPVLVLSVPGLQPLRIGCRDSADLVGFSVLSGSGRFAWCGNVTERSERYGGPREYEPPYMVSGADWLTLAEKFGLAQHLEDKANRALRPKPVPWLPPAGTPNAASGLRRGRWSLGGLAGLLLAVVFVGGWAYGLSIGVRDFYAYQNGTPTTATIDHCVPHGKSSTCYGTWSVGGTPQTGELRGGLPSDWRIGSSLDVRVNGANAYTAGSAGWSFYGFSLLFIVLILSVSVYVVRALLRRRAGR